MSDRDTDLFYGGSVIQGYEPRLSDAVNALVDEKGWTPQQRADYVQTVATALHDARIDPDEGTRLHTLLAGHLVKPADDATAQQWAADARRQLRELHGHEEGTRRLELAKRFIAERPALQQLLNESGAGNHPEIVMALARNPHAFRSRTP